VALKGGKPLSVTTTPMRLVVAPLPLGVLQLSCLDLAGSGLILIQKCKEAHPRIKVVLWSGYLETTISDLLAHTRVVPDAQFAKGGQDDMGEMVETIAELARDAEVAGTAHSAGNE
jgi:hypothetical protein